MGLQNHQSESVSNDDNHGSFCIASCKTATILLLFALEQIKREYTYTHIRTYIYRDMVPNELFNP